MIADFRGRSQSSGIKSSDKSRGRSNKYKILSAIIARRRGTLRSFVVNSRGIKKRIKEMLEEQIIVAVMTYPISSMSSILFMMIT